MRLNQQQVRNLYAETIAEAKAMGEGDKIVFILETEMFYYCTSEAGVDDGKTVLKMNNSNWYLKRISGTKTIAPYSTSTSYLVDDLVEYAGSVWRAITPSNKINWVTANWKPDRPTGAWGGEWKVGAAMNDRALCFHPTALKFYRLWRPTGAPFVAADDPTLATGAWRYQEEPANTNGEFQYSSNTTTVGGSGGLTAGSSPTEKDTVMASDKTWVPIKNNLNTGAINEAGILGAGAMRQLAQIDKARRLGAPFAFSKTQTDTFGTNSLMTDMLLCCVGTITGDHIPYLVGTSAQEQQVMASLMMQRMYSQMATENNDDGFDQWMNLSGTTSSPLIIRDAQATSLPLSDRTDVDGGASITEWFNVAIGAESGTANFFYIQVARNNDVMVNVNSAFVYMHTSGSWYSTAGTVPFTPRISKASSLSCGQGTPAVILAPTAIQYNPDYIGYSS